MSQLVLGTAEFGHPDYQHVDEFEIRKILSCAKEGGINLIDTAESYNCTDFLKKEAHGFCIYTKTRDWKVQLDWGNNELRGILYHYQPSESIQQLPFVHRWVNLGVSVYDRAQLPDNPLRILQVPLSIENRTFENVFNIYRTVFVRSVFNRGEALKQYSVKECLDYVKQFRPDGVIVGVQKASELETILKAWS